MGGPTSADHPPQLFTQEGAEVQSYFLWTTILYCHSSHVTVSSLDDWQIIQFSNNSSAGWVAVSKNQVNFIRYSFLKSADTYIT